MNPGIHHGCLCFFRWWEEGQRLNTGCRIPTMQGGRHCRLAVVFVVGSLTEIMFWLFLFPITSLGRPCFPVPVPPPPTKNQTLAPTKLSYFNLGQRLVWPLIRHALIRQHPDAAVLSLTPPYQATKPSDCRVICLGGCFLHAKVCRHGKYSWFTFLSSQVLPLANSKIK